MKETDRLYLVYKASRRVQKLPSFLKKSSGLDEPVSQAKTAAAAMIEYMER